MLKIKTHLMSNLSQIICYPCSSLFQEHYQDHSLAEITMDQQNNLNGHTVEKNVYMQDSASISDRAKVYTWWFT